MDFGNFASRYTEDDLAGVDMAGLNRDRSPTGSTWPR
jgi:hypothetical protein